MSTTGDNDLSNKEVLDWMKQMAENGAVTQLTSITPNDAVEDYLETNPKDNKPSTVDTHETRLGFFVRWCAENDVTDLNELTGRDVMDFYRERKSELREKGEDGLSKRTLDSNMETLRVFLRYCRKIEAVPKDVPETVPEVELTKEDDVRDDIVEQEKARQIVKYLGKYHYASRDHVVWFILATTGIRLGSIHSLDTKDFYPPSGGDDAYLKLEHRPETGTELKNENAGEREVTIPDELASVLQDYIGENRPDTTDDYGREPLLASEYGRLAQSTIRNIAYRWTCPCAMTGDCPYGETVSECDAANRYNDASKCEGSSATHAIRRGYITELRRKGVPKQTVSDRVDASVDILEKHYVATTESEERRVRAAAYKAALEEAGADDFL